MESPSPIGCSFPYYPRRSDLVDTGRRNSPQFLDATSHECFVKAKTWGWHFVQRTSQSVARRVWPRTGSPTYPNSKSRQSTRSSPTKKPLVVSNKGHRCQAIDSLTRRITKARSGGQCRGCSPISAPRHRHHANCDPLATFIPTENFRVFPCHSVAKLSFCGITRWPSPAPLPRPERSRRARC